MDSASYQKVEEIYYQVLDNKPVDVKAYVAEKGNGGAQIVDTVHDHRLALLSIGGPHLQERALRFHGVLQDAGQWAECEHSHGPEPQARTGGALFDQAAAGEVGEADQHDPGDG
ncbi:MAG: hypothetical protein JKY19_10560, partial [Alcanivoracaceae bacterium]|nr:hypothetical protein [Alcanivoracaceae bacterium]